MFTKTLATLSATAALHGALHAASLKPISPGYADFVSEDGQTVIGRNIFTETTYRWRNGVITSAGALTIPDGSSDDGNVVIGRSGTTGSTRQPFRWTTGPIQILAGSLPGRTRYTPFATSADGSVFVGAAVGGGGSQPFVWRLTTGTIQALPDLPGSTAFGAAMAVSADGRVIAGYSSANGRTEAVVWRDGVLANLSATSDSGDSRAAHLSADGTVVVGSTRLWDQGIFRSVAFRHANGVFTRLGDLPGGTLSSTANAVSADGSTVVGRGSVAAGSEAFRWKDGVMTALGELPGGEYSSQALAVSGDGSVVIGVGGASDLQSQAFIWTASRGLQTLEARLQSLGVSLAGWSRLRDAQDITRDGRFICGSGIRNGEIESYLADLGVPTAPVITATPRADGQAVQVRFTGEAGRGYRLQRASTLAPAAWGADQVLVAGAGQAYEVELPTDLAAGFLRVVAE